MKRGTYYTLKGLDGLFLTIAGIGFTFVLAIGLGEGAMAVWDFFKKLWINPTDRFLIYAFLLAVLYFIPRIILNKD